VIEAGEVANDLDALESVLRESTTLPGPVLIILRSHIGFPSSVMVDTREAHGSPFSPEAVREVKSLLGRDPDATFVFDEALPSDAREFLRTRDDELHAWNARVQAAGQRGRDFLAQLQGGGVHVSAEPAYYPGGGAVATRKAMQKVMDDAVIASPGLIAGSADLTENTGVLMKNIDAMSTTSPGGRQVHYGIREFAMGAALVGMALHGGVRPVGSTFFVFSDYVRPAIRLAALSEAPALFVFTHDSVGVGEDGPTHQPVEHLMSLRAMPGLHVVRPSDANEAIDCARVALTGSHKHPTALILTRQDLPVLTGDAAQASRDGFDKGGYVLRETDNAVASIFATGSEVAVALAAADLLAEKSVPVRVVALPCWACFDEQPFDYRERVIRRDLPSVSVEAGATLGWHKYATTPLGIDTFGMSAPASYIFDYFNITPTAVAAAVENLEGVK
jgi:transketolase